MQKLTVIVGLGLTGLSCVRFLLKKNIPVCVMDTRLQPPHLSTLQKDYPQVPLYLGELPEEVLCNAQEIIVSPGLALTHPALIAAKKAGIKMRGDIDLFIDYAKAPIIGITGANGKSTVTSWVGHMGQMCNVNLLVGGNIGVPVLDLLAESIPAAYVLELSSFQLETTHSLPLHAATILNITPDHQDRYATMTEYTAAKQLIYRTCDTAVFYREQTITQPTFPVKQQTSFGLDAPAADHYGVVKTSTGEWLAFGEEKILPTVEINLPGAHNILNALAALALCRTLNLPWEGLIKSLRTFTGLPHRCQYVAEFAGVTWINDSKGTNVVSTLAAIEGMAKRTTGKIIIILGGDGKGADFSPLAEPLQQHARAALLFGKDADILQTTLTGHVPLYRVSDLVQAVKQAAALASPGDIVLLSPACASLDMFASYAARGDQFMQLVKKMLEI